MIHPFFALGSFDDEREAARAVDTAAQRLRGDDAHGGRAAGPKKTWLRLNFPTKREAGRAKALGMTSSTPHQLGSGACMPMLKHSAFVITVDCPAPTSVDTIARTPALTAWAAPISC
eukprot:COSAG06_NODE_1795_length_8376_cov_3.340462_8_plen_117_part_00